VSDDQVSVKISADASGLKTEMRSAASEVEALAGVSHEAFEKTGHAAGEAGEHVEGLTHKLREFAGEQRSEGRLAGFLAGQIAQLGIASKSAAGEITGIAAAFAFGGGLGIGIELLKIGIEKFNELGAEEEKSAATTKKWAEDATAEIKKFTDGLKLAEEQSGKTGTALKLVTSAHPFKQQVEEGMEELEEARRSKLAVQQEMARITAEFKATGKLGDGESFEATRKNEKNATEAETEAINKLYIARRALRSLDSAASPAIDKEDRETATKKSDEQRKQHAVALTQLQGFGDQEDAQIRKHLADVEKRQSDHESKLKTIKFEEQQAAVANGNRLADENSQRAIERDKREQEEAKKALQELKKETHEAIAAGKEMGNAFGQAFADMATHSTSAVGALKKMAEQMIGSIEKVAEKSIEASFNTAAAAAVSDTAQADGNAVVAGTGAAAAVASTPFIGPALAAAAMASTFALVKGLVGNIHSASGGYDIPSGINPLVQTHANEMILPAPIADTIRERMTGGGGSSGAEVHNHFHLIDASGVRALVESSDFAKAMGEAQRNGRL
jgi:hypothetical protein